MLALWRTHFRNTKKVENLKSRQTKESLRKLNQMDFDPHDVTKEEIDEITKNPIFDENNISDFILNEYGVEKRNIILVIILRFCSRTFPEAPLRGHHVSAIAWPNSSTVLWNSATTQF